MYRSQNSVYVRVCVCFFFKIKLIDSKKGHKSIYFIIEKVALSFTRFMDEHAKCTLYTRV